MVRRIGERADNRELLQCTAIRARFRVPNLMRIRLITRRSRLVAHDSLGAPEARPEPFLSLPKSLHPEN